MKIPKKVKILGTTYTIKLRKRKIFYKPFGECEGVIDFEKRIILINNTLEEEHKKEVFLHELIHAMIEKAEITLDDEVEEEICEGVSTVLLGVIRDNPEIFT